MNKKDYDQYVKEMSPNSPLWKNLLCAFLIGGAICTVGEALRKGFEAVGLNEEKTASALCITMIFLGALLTALSLYDNLAKHAGAGTLVPITGFSNAVVSQAMEFRTEGFILGVGAKMFVIAGPVIAYGTVASVIYGMIYWIMQIL